MNAVTEAIPRVVISPSHPYCLITAPLPIVPVRSQAIERRAPARRTNDITRVPARIAPAPLGLRLCVSALLFVLLASASAVVAEQIHPKWFSSFENYIRPGSPAISNQHAQLLDHVLLVSSSPAAITYAVPATSYSVVISVDHPCWFVVRSPAGGSRTLEEMTMLPTASPMSIPVHGSSSIMVAAQTRSITISEGLKVLGTIKTPRAGVVYSFFPKS